MPIGNKIFEIRKSLNLTQERFANILGVDHAHISKIEKNKGTPSELLLNHICCRFFISKEWLTNDQGEMITSPVDVIVRQLAAYGQQVLTDAFFKVLKEYGTNNSLRVSLQSLMARYGEQAIIEALNMILKESDGNIVTAESFTRRLYDKKPELKRMVDILYTIFTADDQRLEAWASIQFDRAFPADVVEDAQKKQQESDRQSSSG